MKIHAICCTTRIFVPADFTGLIRGETSGNLYVSPIIEIEGGLLVENASNPAKNRRFIGDYKKDDKYNVVELIVEGGCDVWIRYCDETVPQVVTVTSQDLVVRGD